jgi:hypothetical protein
MTFLLVLQHPTFLNYTQLEISGDNSEIYYYQSELSGSEHKELTAKPVSFAGPSQEVTYIRPADPADSVSITFRQTGGGEVFTEQLTPQESQTGSYQIGWHGEDDWGKYTLEVSTQQRELESTDLYFLPNTVIGSTWGLLQLIVPSFNAASLPPTEAPSGRISFTPRTTIWRYQIINQSQFAFDKMRMIRNGTVITDAPPAEQVYYWPTDEGQPAMDGQAMLMASYDDGANIGFWDGFRPRRRQAFANHREVPEIKNPFQPLRTPPGRKSAEDERWERYVADQDMVDEVSRQLCTIHGELYASSTKRRLPRLGR